MIDANREGEDYIKKFIGAIEIKIKEKKHQINIVAHGFDVTDFDFTLNFTINNKKNIILKIDYGDLDAWAKGNEMPGKKLLNEKVQELIGKL